MKIGLLVATVAVVLGGVVGTLVVRDPGYVLVVYDQMAVETSLWLGLGLLAGACLVVFVIVYMLVKISASGRHLGAWRRERRSQGARRQTVRGLMLMAEGEWAEARRLLTATAPDAQSPLINYLNAARAAHEMGDGDGRDDLLRRAHESTPAARLAVGLTQAELQKSAGQWEQCLATVLQLRSHHPRHPQVLSMLAECYEHLADWRALVALLPELKKAGLVQGEELTQLQVRAWSHQLAAADAPPAATWKLIPRELRREPALVASYARQLAETGDVGEAESAIRTALDRDWQAELVELYGRVVSGDVERQLVVAEGWLKERPNDAGLLLTLGRICLMNHLWAQAREYLEASLRLRRSPDVYGELGRLCSALGDVDRGTEYLGLSLPGLPDLPMPDMRAQAVS